MLIRQFCTILLLALCSNSLQAETYTREHTYTALSADTEATSRIIAIDQVRKLLINTIGAHIAQTITISQDGSNSSYARDDVEAVTANLTEVNIVEERWDKGSYYVKAMIEADTRNILATLAEYKNDHSDKSHQLLKSLTFNEQVLAKSREKIALLRKELATAKTDYEISRLTEKYTSELNKLATDEMFVRGFKHQQQAEYSAAQSWYLKAAEQGSAVAQQMLGALYMNGQGTKQDFNQAADWFKKAAAQGEPIAQYFLGILYLEGNGVAQDKSTAVDWLHRSAEQGYTLAQFQLGNMYLNGNGVEQKYYMAAHWYRMAADQMDAKAQYALGLLYTDGKGVAKSASEALYWYRKAAQLGLEEAKQKIEEN